MKQLKFKPDLVLLILSGRKTITWRLFDDKDLQVGDKLEFLNSETKEKFANAEIVELREKKIVDINGEDRIGHETVGEGEELLKHYEALYKRVINPGERIKIIKFKLT